MIVPASKHSVVANSAGGLAFSVSVRTHSVSTDQPAHAGGTDSAPTPLELLSVALASCIALYVRRYCIARHMQADDFAVGVKPLWRDDRITRFDVMLHVPFNIPREQYTALYEIARTCPVHNTLSHVPEITVQLQQQEPATAGLMAHVNSADS